MSQGSRNNPGRKGTKVREPGESGKFVPDGPKEWSGTSGPQVCEPVGSAEMRTNSSSGSLCDKVREPGDWENLSQTVQKKMGHVGREYADPS
ncbi:hypothetical protein KI387_033972, partial [Taxus chinensis]